MSTKTVDSILFEVPFNHLLDLPEITLPEIGSYFSLQYLEAKLPSIQGKKEKLKFLSSHQTEWGFFISKGFVPFPGEVIEQKNDEMIAAIKEELKEGKEGLLGVNHLMTRQRTLMGELLEFAFEKYAPALDSAVSEAQQLNLITRERDNAQSKLDSAPSLTSAGAKNPRTIIKYLSRIKFLNREEARVLDADREEVKAGGDLPTANFTGKINQLSTLFLDLMETHQNGRPLLEVTKEDMKRIIQLVFRWKGQEISKDTLDTYFNAKSSHRRAKGPNRIDLSGIEDLEDF